MSNLKCCGVDSRWVENVPGKGYFYCGECKNEVKEFVEINRSEIESSIKYWISPLGKSTVDAAERFIGGFKIFDLKKEASVEEIMDAIIYDTTIFSINTGIVLTGVVLCQEHVKTLNRSVLYLPGGKINILNNFADPEGKYYPLGVSYINY